MLNTVALLLASNVFTTFAWYGNRHTWRDKLLRTGILALAHNLLRGGASRRLNAERERAVAAA
ncbi:MAG: hypothetical protein EXR69_13980 [Myxococcales bacterium]|nr:hypothetical protein [Myxococcales bacterium]